MGVLSTIVGFLKSIFSGRQVQAGKADQMGQARDDATVKQVKTGQIDSGGDVTIGASPILLF